MAKKDAGNSNKSAPGVPFKPGQSGNVSGRPKKREDLAARCVRAVDDVVVEAWIREVQTFGEDWVECSKLLAAYGYGKPTQKLEHTGSVAISVIDPYAVPSE